MKLVLATLHSRYSHASLALPSLAAACGGIAATARVIREWTIHEHPDRLLRRLVSEDADLYGFSCYIWNVEQTLKLAADLKQVRPRAAIVMGGPEVSYGAFDLMTRHPAIDCVVRGEGEESFRELAGLVAACGGIPPGELLETVAGITFRDGAVTIANPDRPPACLDSLPSPFRAGLVDLAKPLVYVETSRGCPFCCAFCLSSLDRTVRSYSPERIREDMSFLMAREVATVKLVDRTFNYDADRAGAIWEYIIRHNRSSRFHFEIAADLLTEEHFALLRTVPDGMFRFEIGVQSGDAGTLERVGRRTDLERLLANVRRLLRETGIVVHLDLVAGLPGEGYAGFLASLEQLLVTGPHHIQVEPLKVLKGTPMRRIAEEEGYVYAAAPPYKILRTPALSFEEIGRIEVISRLLDLIANSGRFPVFLSAVAKDMPLSSFFEQLASHLDADAESVAPGSFTELCDLIEGFIAVSGTERALLSDALCFDFCRVEYPSTARFPACFGQVAGDREMRGAGAAVFSGAGTIPAGARVRRYRRHFLRNYLETPWGANPVEVLFTYIALSGEGERVVTTCVGGGA